MAKKAKPASSKQKSSTGATKIGSKAVSRTAARAPAVRAAATSPTRATKSTTVKATSKASGHGKTAAKATGSKPSATQKSKSKLSADALAKATVLAKAKVAKSGGAKPLGSKANLKSADKAQEKRVEKVATKDAAAKTELAIEKAKGPVGMPVTKKAGAGEKLAKATVEAPLRPGTEISKAEPLRVGSASVAVPSVMSKQARSGAGAPESVSEKKSSKGGAKASEPAVEKKGKKSKGLTVALDRGADLGAQWKSLYDRSRELEAVPYKMSETYEPRTALMHKVLGWGFVLSNQNDRLEVLFQDGIKMLISNYKG